MSILPFIVHINVDIVDREPEFNAPIGNFYFPCQFIIYKSPLRQPSCTNYILYK